MKSLSPFVLLTLVSSILARQAGTPPPQTQKPEDVDVVRITTNLEWMDFEIVN